MLTNVWSFVIVIEIKYFERIFFLLKCEEDINGAFVIEDIKFLFYSFNNFFFITRKHSQLLLNWNNFCNLFLFYAAYFFLVFNFFFLINVIVINIIKKSFLFLSYMYIWCIISIICKYQSDCEININIRSPLKYDHVMKHG